MQKYRWRKYNMDKKLSVIIPAYNAEKYIGKTLEAIVGQTIFTQLNIIVVNDGSEDLTSEVVSEYVRKYQNISIYNCKHLGVSHARNIGIKNCRTKYIIFCDADDLPYENMYEELLNKIEIGNYDLVGCNFYSERTGKLMGVDEETNLTSHDKILEFSLNYLGKVNKNDKVLWGAVYINVYKKDIIEKINLKFDERISFAEDLLFTFEYLMNCERAFFSKDCLYTYCCRANSLMMSHRYVYIDNMLEKRMIVVNRLRELCIQHNVRDFEERLDDTTRSFTKEIIGNTFHNKSFSKDRIIDELIEIYNNNTVKNAFFNYKVNLKMDDFKTVLLYTAIKECRIKLIYLYYRVRLRRIKSYANG
jgi:glycosyltransferase involved in cell wall biosynthesis